MLSMGGLYQTYHRSSFVFAILTYFHFPLSSVANQRVPRTLVSWFAAYQLSSCRSRSAFCESNPGNPVWLSPPPLVLRFEDVVRCLKFPF